MRKPNVLVMRAAGSEAISMIAVDLPDDERAVELARRMAEHTGRAVTVRDADGEVLDTIPATSKN